MCASKPRPPTVPVWLPVACSSPLTALPFRLLFTRDRLDHRLWNSVRAHDIVAEHTDTPRRDGAHRVLGMPGHTQLADQEDVERSVEDFGDLERDGHATTRQRQDNDIVAPGVVPQLRRQLDARFAPIRKGTMRLRGHR